MIRLTIACPEADVSDANALFSCLGQSEADGFTFGASTWESGGGERYLLASLYTDATILGALVSPLTAPAWNVNLAAAERAQDLLEIVTPERLDAEGPEIALAIPMMITVIVGVEPAQALQLLGVHPVEEIE